MAALHMTLVILKCDGQTCEKTFGLPNGDLSPMEEQS